MIHDSETTKSHFVTLDEDEAVRLNRWLRQVLDAQERDMLGLGMMDHDTKRLVTELADALEPQ